MKAGKIEKVVMNGKEFPVENNEDYKLEFNVLCDSQLNEINIEFIGGEKITLWATNPNIVLLKKYLKCSTTTKESK